MKIGIMSEEQRFGLKVEITTSLIWEGGGHTAGYLVLDRFATQR